MIETHVQPVNKRFLKLNNRKVEMVNLEFFAHDNSIYHA